MQEYFFLFTLLLVYPSPLLRPTFPSAAANSSCTFAQEDLNIAVPFRSRVSMEIYLAKTVDRLTRGDGVRYNTLFVLLRISLRHRIASACDEILILNMGRIASRAPIVIFHPILRSAAFIPSSFVSLAKFSQPDVYHESKHFSKN